MASPKSENDISTLRIPELKKLMEQKGIEGRSKITKKADMIQLIHLHNQNTKKEEIKNFIGSKTSNKAQSVELKHQYDDQDLEQILILSKRIGKSLKLYAHQCVEDEDFKKKWLKELYRIEQEITSLNHK
jgi:hypothetical protein